MAVIRTASGKIVSTTRRQDAGPQAGDERRGPVGCTGPLARGSGVDYDLRRDDPYGYYDELDWDVVVREGCDNYARLLVRMEEIAESARIVEQCSPGHKQRRAMPAATPTAVSASMTVVTIPSTSPSQRS
jgi:NADH:ubiquinone oxidoreductase subunit D